MADGSQRLKKLQDYVGKARERHPASVIIDVEKDYEARINKSLHSLQDQVKQHEAALEQLRNHAPQISFDQPSEEPSSRLKQLRAITAAYRSLNSTEPVLPLPNSPLPALLALRSTLNTIDQTKVSIKETYDSITKARARLCLEEDDLKDALELTRALERRTEKARKEDEDLSQRTPEGLAKAMIQEELQKERHYSAEMGKLILALNTFVDEHLAAMLAAEELGGPVVGDLMEVNNEMLKAGFTRQGKPKKAKKGSAKAEAGGRDNLESEPALQGEKETAGADFRELMEDLLNAAAGDEDLGPYVNIKRESAAVRFLVRSKVAQFHPEDARKLRLIDFSQDLDE